MLIRISRLMSIAVFVVTVFVLLLKDELAPASILIVGASVAWWIDFERR